MPSGVCWLPYITSALLGQREVSVCTYVRACMCVRSLGKLMIVNFMIYLHLIILCVCMCIDIVIVPYIFSLYINTIITLQR